MDFIKKYYYLIMLIIVTTIMIFLITILDRIVTLEEMKVTFIDLLN